MFESSIHDEGSVAMNGYTKSSLFGTKKTVHDSRPVARNGIVNLTPMWGYEEPPPQEWVVDSFIPKGYPTILAADGGSGKSFLALHLAACVATGSPFLGLSTVRGNVLYLDFELQDVDQQRRLSKVLAGMGLDQDHSSLEERLFHYSPTESLSDSDLHDSMRDVVQFYEVELVVLDSLSFSLGGDATDQETVIRAFREMSSWDTTILCIDHIAANARFDMSKARPFGSTFKRNYARASYTLAPVDGGGRMLRCDKSNFGPEGDLICFDQTHTDDGRVLFEVIGLTDDAMAGAYAHMKAHEITLAAVEDIFSSGKRHHVTLDEIAKWREDNDQGIKMGTVRNHLTGLIKSRRIERIGDDQYRPFTTSSPLGTVNRESDKNVHFDLNESVITSGGIGIVKDTVSTVTGRIAIQLASGEVKYFYPDEVQRDEQTTKER